MPVPVMKILALGLFFAVLVLLSVMYFHHVWGLGLLTAVAYYFILRNQDNVWKGVSIVLCVVFMWGLAYHLVGSDLWTQTKAGIDTVFSSVKSKVLQ